MRIVEHEGYYVEPDALTKYIQLVTTAATDYQQLVKPMADGDIGSHRKELIGTPIHSGGAGEFTDACGEMLTNLAKLYGDLRNFTDVIGDNLTFMKDVLTKNYTTYLELETKQAKAFNDILLSLDSNDRGGDDGPS